ncbi:MAG: EAL domain-containing protein [Lachnospiraceae bacterium]|nr:EAL domain-containing protein [Lachnospiraceae bacterium]
MRANADKDFTKYVLIVDDEEVNREMLGMILSSSYKVMYASDGDEALDMINSFSDFLSLVLLDILMPHKNGYEVLEEIAGDPSLQKIPVVVLTSEKEAEIKSLKLGAADFLTKPYDLPEVILARVAHAIDLYENANLIHATEKDNLTGLYNREFFFEYCDQYLKHHPDADVDAIVININRFHLINAMYGRAFGDQVLCAVSNRLRHSVMVLGGLASRYDADSFYLCVPHVESYEELYKSILSGVTEVLSDGESRLRIGINSNMPKDNSVEDNFSWALQACNSLRNQIGAPYAFFDENMHKKQIREAVLIDDFETALEEHQFKVFYQPKFNIEGDEPVLSSAEALVRWNHPKLGFISPGEFIPLFEENGLVRKLDRYVWSEAGRQIREWYDQIGVYMSVSVNVSRMDMYDDDITAFLSDIVINNDIPDGKYLLEVTESAYTDNAEQIIDVVKRLRAIGFKIEMDDFGTGYSSLNMLYALPIDILKIDKEFLRNILTDERAKKMVDLVIDIAGFMGIPTIAEGVELKEEYEVLKEMGCNVIQGYYFSKPLPVEDMTKMIMERKDDIK